jgi:hypothetical protein
MRNAAMVLGIIGGAIAVVVGFFGYAAVWFGEEFPETTQAAQEAGILSVVQNPMLIKAAAFIAPILAITGGAMAPSRPIIAGIFLGAAAAGILLAFDFDVFTMFPIGMCGLAAVLAIMGGILPPKPAHH